MTGRIDAGDLAPLARKRNGSCGASLWTSKRRYPNACSREFLTPTVDGSVRIRSGTLAQKLRPQCCESFRLPRILACVPTGFQTPEALS